MVISYCEFCGLYWRFECVDDLMICALCGCPLLGSLPMFEMEGI